MLKVWETSPKEVRVAHRKKTAGRTLEAGYQVGARRTLAISLAGAWDLVISPNGLRAWLGGAPRSLVLGKNYRLSDSTRGIVRVFRSGSHLRLTWQPPDWPKPSLIQVRVIRAVKGATISFHQEHLPNARLRAERRRHFLGALDELERLARRA